MINFNLQLEHLRKIFEELLDLVPEDEFYSDKWQDLMKELKRLADVIEALESIVEIMDTRDLAAPAKKARIIPYLLRLRRLGFSNEMLNINQFISHQYSNI